MDNIVRFKLYSIPEEGWTSVVRIVDLKSYMTTVLTKNPFNPQSLSLGVFFSP